MEQSGGGVFRQVSIEETELVVKYSSEDGIDQINLIQPNGELFGQQDVATGTQQVSYELGASYAPGEYTIVALSDGESIGESSVSIQPNVEINEMGIGRNQPEKMWDGGENNTDRNAFFTTDEEVFVTIENHGTGPNAITKLYFIGDVPYPSDDEGTNYVESDDVSGIYDPESDSEVQQVIIAPGEQITLYSSRSPFAFVPGIGTSCSESSKTGEFDLILESKIGGGQISKTYSIHYSASQESDGCEISISED
ncbi:hypothetical protein HARCEL1_12355 [Halococcoides cellulosivorans]|uniref:Uncharacterized protein n=1 Tax=Halococcoides cellulosivorans TaxID=1679096 RepID=A0A2R4X4K9_9EURY|nr:hypothetical protein HARCEL1_12355 [Halococcoides cellulosivorans]